MLSGDGVVVERAATAGVPDQRGHPDDTAGARRLLAAAESALLAGRVQDTVMLLDDAARFVVTPELSVGLLQARARLALMGGPPVPDAVDRLAESAEGVSRPYAGRLLVDAAALAIYAHQLPRAVELAQRARALAGDDDQLRAAAAVTLGVAHAFAGRMGEALPLLDEHVNLAAVSTSPVEGVHLLQRLVVALSWAQRHVDAVRHAQRFVSAARETGAVGVLPLALALQGHASLWTGQWDGGVLAAGEALHLAESLGQRALAGYASAILALYAGLRGQDADCRAAAARAHELIDATGVETFPDMALGAIGLLELSRGDVDAAGEAFTVAWAKAEGSGPHTLVYWQPGVVEACVLAGRPERARPMLRALERRAQVSAVVWEPMMLARCRALLASDEEIDARYAEAVAAQQRPVAAYPLARTLFAYGHRLLTLGRREDARVRLAEALAGFERVGAVGWEARTRQLLAELPAAPAACEPPSTVATPAFGVRLLAGYAVDGATRLPQGVQAQAVKYVALHGGAVHVDELVEALWPEQPPDVARPRLRNVLNRVRTACGPILVREAGTVRLADGVLVDVTSFEAAVARALAEPAQRAQWAEAAVSAYAGELLPQDRLLDWTAAPRERLARQHLQMLDVLAHAVDGEERLRWLERAADADPYDDSRFVDIARLHLAAGRRGRAADALSRAVRVTEELGVDPPPTLEQLTCE